MPEPTRLRKVVCALIVAGVAIGVWWIVQVRSAAPPPPPVTMPGAPAK